MHKKFLLAALEQAWLGRGICAPNPSVGAVAVQNDKIIAQACHLGAGTPHAEQLVLNQISGSPKDITLYVTLEPCNHWGRTPPCVNAIIERGIKRVVYAYRDPNPVVAANNTPVILSRNNIEVIHYPVSEINHFYQSYDYWTRTGKPWVTVKIAQTLDGKIAMRGKREQLSNSRCFEFTHQNRRHCDVILTTAQTIQVDNPLLNVRLPGKEQSKPLAVLDRKNRLNPKANVLTIDRHCHIYHEATNAPRFLLPNCSYHPVATDESGLLRLEAVLSHIGSLGYHDVWVEAGGKLFSALHQAKLVHRTYIYLVPRWLGTDATAVYPVANPLAQNCKVSWQPIDDNVIVSLDWENAREGAACSQD
ncbi:bifunctional diaminohydroxyphosphoribosylaminopyrimidine deaminase/5-amino-6-(5-phosphoribosylamino)uracil reductase RibD [Legionella londiniensis]|uniref:Riboflavin biosynthesis protein RibD n=1 Tax=Legionella londiniensis TaxID=45068 RepID=A0A0W0VR30_9GAMM|nr:bifunctional diaminohydroxyphosphoribosylaminopyrimidine deaminase/5-amino-6-(5-phosphoribosylamino)uracil reductase RibD [Legionella londiniensis]KTD22501.1 riboflavin biosynthesis protein RibD [Legionella londiniensis]STX93346.1 riboflavin biosynthesis protein RibD [Legionella londiniensis]